MVVAILLLLFVFPSVCSSGVDQQDDSLSVLIATYPESGHAIPAVAIAQALQDRGHNVKFMMNDYSEDNAAARRASKVLKSNNIELIKAGFAEMSPSDQSKMNSTSFLSAIYLLVSVMQSNCDAMIDTMKAVHSQFDVVLVDVMLPSVATWLVTNRVGATFELWPTVVLTKLTLPNFPCPVSVPSLHYVMSEEMPYLDRLVSSLLILTMYLPAPFESPTLSSAGVTHPVIIGTTMGFEQATPAYPMMHFVGPLVSTKPSVDPFPSALQEWLSSRQPNSVVYISMGSQWLMTSKVAHSLIPGILESNFDIAWSLQENNRFVLDGLDDAIWNSSRVFISNWFPQSELLRHSAISFAALHGGMGGINDAIIAGVPMLCLPIDADQFTNCAKVHLRHIGVHISGSTITKEGVISAVHELREDKYAKSVEKMQKIFKASGGVEKVVELIEYYHDVGYNHLVPVFIKYNWSAVTFHNLDVKLTLIILLLLLGSLGCLCLKNLYKCCRKDKYKLE